MAEGSTDFQSILVKPLGVLARQSTDVLAIDDRFIAAALRHICENACDGLDVEDILKVVPLSRSVLERRFSKILGISPKGEILRIRLDRVCRLLAESDLSLAEVAGKAGKPGHCKWKGRSFFALLACISSFMHLHVRTTIDVPDDLIKRVRPLLAERKMTFRALVIDAVERAIEVPAASFRLRDASAGRAGDDTAVSSEAINRAINEAREPSFQG